MSARPDADSIGAVVAELVAVTPLGEDVTDEAALAALGDHVERVSRNGQGRVCTPSSSAWTAGAACRCTTASR